MTSVGKFTPDIPMSFKDMKKGLRKGLSGNRFLWWPFIPSIETNQRITQYPKLFGEIFTQRELFILEHQELTRNLKKNPNYVEKTLTEIETQLISKFELNEEDLVNMNTKLRLLIHVIRRKDSTFSLAAQLLENPEKYLDPRPKNFKIVHFTFKKLLFNFLPRTWSTLNAIGALDEKYLNLMFLDCFIELLPSNFIFTLFDAYLLEGIKIFYRYGLGIIKGYKKFIKIKRYRTAQQFWLAVKSDATSLCEKFKPQVNKRNSLRKNEKVFGNTEWEVPVMLSKYLRVPEILPPIDSFLLVNHAKNPDFLQRGYVGKFPFDLGRSPFEKLRRPMSVTQAKIKALKEAAHRNFEIEEFGDSGIPESPFSTKSRKSLDSTLSMSSYSPEFRNSTKERNFRISSFSLSGRFASFSFSPNSGIPESEKLDFKEQKEEEEVKIDEKLEKKKSKDLIPLAPPEFRNCVSADNSPLKPLIRTKSARMMPEKTWAEKLMTKRRESFDSRMKTKTQSELALISFLQRGKVRNPISRSESSNSVFMSIQQEFDNNEDENEIENEFEFEPINEDESENESDEVSESELIATDFFTENSMILDHESALRLVRFLPKSVLKPQSLDLIYASYIHGTKLNNVYEALEDKNPIIVLIQLFPPNEHIFIGAYINEQISPISAHFKGNSSCFTFRLDSPYMAKNQWNGERNQLKTQNLYNFKFPTPIAVSNIFSLENETENETENEKKNENEKAENEKIENSSQSSESSVEEYEPEVKRGLGFKSRQSSFYTIGDPEQIENYLATSISIMQGDETFDDDDELKSHTDELNSQSDELHSDDIVSENGLSLDTKNIIQTSKGLKGNNSGFSPKSPKIGFSPKSDKNKSFSDDEFSTKNNFPKKPKSLISPKINQLKLKIEELHKQAQNKSKSENQGFNDLDSQSSGKSQDLSDKNDEIEKLNDELNEEIEKESLVTKLKKELSRLSLTTKNEKNIEQGFAYTALHYLIMGEGRNSILLTENGKQEQEEKDKDNFQEKNPLLKSANSIKDVFQTDNGLNGANFQIVLTEPCENFGRKFLNPEQSSRRSFINPQIYTYDVMSVEIFIGNKKNRNSVSFSDNSNV